jgi:3-dehydroquinate dehydratase
MKLTEKQLHMLQQADLVDMTHQARQKAALLLNDQGFAVLSVAISNLITEMVEHPERLVREFGS